MLTTYPVLTHGAESLLQESAQAMGVRVLGKIVILAVLLFLTAASPVVAQGSAVGVTVTFPSDPLQVGKIYVVTVTLTNVSNSTVQLEFVGIHFDWVNPIVFYIGGHSGDIAILGPGEKITYNIAEGIPFNATPGTHKLYTNVRYRLLGGGNSAAVFNWYWVNDVQITTNTESPAAQPTSPAGPQLSFTPETLAVVVAAVAIGLFLERDRVKALSRKRSTKSSKTKRNQRKEEEDTF